MAIVYRKASSLALTAGETVGSVTNIMSNDCERLFEASMFTHYMWASPLFVVVIVALVSLEIGPSALVGFGLLLLLLPVQAAMGKQVGASKRAMLPGRQ